MEHVPRARVSAFRHPLGSRLVGMENIRSRMRQLAEECRAELFSIESPGPDAAEQVALTRPLDAMMLANGVRIKRIYLGSSPRHPAVMDAVLWLIANGGEVRTAAAAPVRIAIFDRQTALLFNDPAGPGAAESALEVGPEVAAALCSLFFHTWVLGAWIERPGPAIDVLSKQERAVLQLLAKGYTDEVVARRLGMSVRTERRVVADLLARLGASGRFQAGLRAAEAGWAAAGRADADCPAR